ncbi:MAG: glutamine--fructose-6-phosphate transaminase (isomerizing) [Lachnospirales bacterium]
MCGIVGYVGKRDVVNILIDGLKKLEYRGYDSAGIAVFDKSKDELVSVREKGRIANLQEVIDKTDIGGHVGIGHTRWATHGVPSVLNAHPHCNRDKSIYVVHNGIIENYIALKNNLISKGYEFVSETDTETIAHLIDMYKNQGLKMKEIVFELSKILTGAYALGILDKENGDTLYCLKKDSPLVIGKGDGENFIASDVPPIIESTRDVYFLEDDEVAILTKDSIEIYDKNANLLDKELVHVDWDVEAAEKAGFEYFMEKEIYEQPKVIRDTIAGRLLKDEVSLDGIKITKDDLEKIDRVYIVACGTAAYAGKLCKYAIEKLLKIPVVSEVASEFRYNDPIIDENTLLILVSQSGETADTLAALRLGKSKNARILSVVNVLGSSIAREADDVFYTLAGPEIAVASTKAYTSQVVALYIVAIHFALTMGKITKDEYTKLRLDLENLPELASEVLESNDEVKGIVEKYSASKNVFYIGRGIDFFTCLEGALKLKEIAYIHCEPYPAGELKHGPIALLEEGSLVVGVATQFNVLEKTLSNLQECKARGAKVLCITHEKTDELLTICDDIILIPKTSELMLPILSNIIQQFIALHFSIFLGHDVDKPRNLAKSVTVE